MPAHSSFWLVSQAQFVNQCTSEGFQLFEAPEKKTRGSKQVVAVVASSTALLEKEKLELELAELRKAKAQA